MIYPQVGAKIYLDLLHRKSTGSGAARILSERQLLGLEILMSRIFQGEFSDDTRLNDHHWRGQQAVKSRGAFLHNIMPLISAPNMHGLDSTEHAGQRTELKALQDSCEGDEYMLMCAVRLLWPSSEDRSNEFTAEKVMEMTFTTI